MYVCCYFGWGTARVSIRSSRHRYRYDLSDRYGVYRKRYPHGSDTAITFTVTLMGVGSVIGNYAIGAVIEGVKRLYGAETQTGLLRGLQAGYGFIGLCAAICAISGCVLYRYLNHRQELI